MLRTAVLAALVGAGVMASFVDPAMAACDPAYRMKCDRLPEPQRMRCLERCPQKARPSSNTAGTGSYGKAEIKKKNVPTVKPNE